MPNNSNTFDALVTKARQMLSCSYTPYSKYPVGAALLCKDGSVFGGCNIENASYGATMCAERTAIFQAVANGHRTFQAIAVVCKDPNSIPYPCGMCLAVMSEFFEPDTKVIIDSIKAGRMVYRLEELLPKQFTLLEEETNK